jgi:hypothetical protein
MHKSIASKTECTKNLKLKRPQSTFHRTRKDIKVETECVQKPISLETSMKCTKRDEFYFHKNDSDTKKVVISTGPSYKCRSKAISPPGEDSRKTKLYRSYSSDDIDSFLANDDSLIKKSEYNIGGYIRDKVVRLKENK